MTAVVTSAAAQALADACLHAGFDLAGPFSAGRWNRAAPETERLPAFGEDCLAVVVGNTRRLWAVVRAAWAADATLRASAHPVDDYTQSAISAAARATGLRFHALWAHRTQPRAIPIQRMAQAAGLAWLSPSHLSVHPIHGPWISLRAVVVLDAPAPPEAPSARDTCTACAQPCVPALRAVVGDATRPDGLRVGPDWRRWLAVRDACPVGRDHRFGDDQIEYHYAKTRALLGSPSTPQRLR